MAKTVKLEDEVYQELENFRRKRETFSDAVRRLLKISEAIGQLEDLIEGQISFREGQRECLEEKVAAD